MTLTKWSPAATGLQTLLQDFWGDVAPRTHGFAEGWAFPAVNTRETEQAFELAFQVPGRDKQDFQITVDKGLLTVSYEKKDETKDEQGKWIRREYQLRSFKRSFQLGDQIDAEAIQASYVQGILTLVLPKKAEARPAVRQITIQ